MLFAYHAMTGKEALLFVAIAVVFLAFIAWATRDRDGYEHDGWHD